MHFLFFISIYSIELAVNIDYKAKVDFLHFQQWCNKGYTAVYTYFLIFFQRIIAKNMTIRIIYLLEFLVT